MIIQRFNLNLIPNQSPVIVHVNQYDTGTGRLIATLYEGNEPYSPNGTAVIQGTKPDGHGFQYTATLEGNVVTADLTEQMSPVAGDVRTQIVVTESSGVTGTFVFIMRVQPSALPSDTDMSESDYQYIEEAIREAQEAVQTAQEATETAQEAVERAQEAIAETQENAEDSEAWAQGTRGGIPVDPTDPTYEHNAEYWAQYAERYAQGGLHYKNSIPFADIPTTGMREGDMYNITDDFTTDSRFEEGAGIEVKGGTNIAWNSDNKWDVLALPPKTTFNGRSGSILPMAGDYDSRKILLSSALHIGGETQNDVQEALEALSDDGVQSFNGRSGSVLPMAGDYDSDKILLASALHIGGETQDNVQEALEALSDGGGHTILNGLGQEMPQRKNLRFAGANVSDDAENDTTNVTISGGGSGGSTITVTTTETSLYGESVIISDGVSTFTGVFDSSGVCVIDGVTATGTLTITSGAAVNQLNVPYYGNYTTFLSFWAATINITTDPDIVSAIVKKDGVQIGTVNFTSGSGTYIAGSTGAYTFEVTVGGVVFSSPTVTVTEQTTYNTTIDIFSATLNISTSSSSLYGKTITIKKGSTVVGTTAFSAQGSATYTVHETGTYTCECEGYSGSATVSAETTYNVTINAGLDLSAWITAGSTTGYPLNPSSYADFSALEADEAAVRQLMLVHDAVDYLAQAVAGDSLMEDVINSDVCAKWINLRDYALDTLYANSDIASVMDTADKYFYGEWVENSGTWGAKGNVPVMTANNAPYGEAFCSSYYQNQDLFNAYRAFSHNTLTDISSDYRGWIGNTTAGNYVGYKFINPICVKRLGLANYYGVAGTSYSFKLEGSNDGATWYPLLSDTFTGAPDSAQSAQVAEYYSINNDDYYTQYKVTLLDNLSNARQGIRLQFYGRELTVKQASAPIDGREYIQIGSDYYTEDWGEKEFNSTAKWIYDHGVEPYTQIKTYTYGSGELAEKLSDRLHLYQPSQSQSLALVYIENEDVHTYTMFAKVGQRLQTLGGTDGSIRMSFLTTLPTDSYTVTDGAFVIIKPPLTDTKVSLSGENTYTTNPAIRINTYSSSAGGEIDIEEWWLE